MRRRRLVAVALALAGLPWMPARADQQPNDRDGGAFEQAPGVHIEKADPGPAAERRRRLEVWRVLYLERLRFLRAECDGLFGALERSSLASSAAHCERLASSASKVDRRGLFSSSDVRIDRVLFGSLERFAAGAQECLGGRYLRAYELLHEARAGLRWIDRRVASGLRPPIPLPGLGE